MPPSVNVKTAQKHDYPSKAHRRSHARRTAVERSNSRVKDPASIDVAKGWCCPRQPMGSRTIAHVGRRLSASWILASLLPGETGGGERTRTAGFHVANVLARISADSGEPSGQVRELSTRLRALVSGSVRGAFTG